MNNNLLFFKVCKDGKTPIKNQKFSDVKTLRKLEDIKTNFFNVGLPCGPNNLIILDIDDKDDGINEWLKYVQQFEEPKTVIQKSANGGRHYIFKHHSLLYTDEENELIDRLKNKAKYRGKGIDIRKNNGYIVCEPSSIKGKKYEFIKHYRDNEILEIPLTLLNWILEFEDTKTNMNILNDNLVILEDICDLIKVLNYFNNCNTNEWLKITACIKNLLHIYNKLDETELKQIWDNIKLNINFNVMIYKYNISRVCRDAFRAGSLT